MYIVSATPLQIISFLTMPSLLYASFFLLAIYFWRKRNFISAALLPVLGFIVARYYFPMVVWLNGLGADSFEEAQSFDITEAFYFVGTLIGSLNPSDWRLVLVGVAATIFAVVLVLSLFYFVLKIIKQPHLFNFVIITLGLVAFAIPVSHHYQKVSSTFVSNSKTFKNIHENYSNKESLLDYKPIHNKPVHVIVYIGESTTSLHWGLSGYPANTTPELSDFSKKFEGLLNFNNVKSTHTHTSRSLLEALSLSISNESAFVQTVDAKRASLPAVLSLLNIPSSLLSTQRRSGAANYASTIIFSHVQDKNYAEEFSHLLGSAMGGVEVFDHQHFFADPSIFNKEGVHSRVTFLHSYAGHFNYHQNIPENFRQTDSAFFAHATPELLYGNKVKFSDTSITRAYDDALRYVDRNLSFLVNSIQHIKQPTVVVYFSDHGESVETGKVHDTAAYQTEMSHIPFLLYFNEAAQQAIPEIYQEFKQASIDDRPSTLAQLSPTVLRILGYEASKTGQDLKGVGLDTEEKLPPIVVRKIGQGLSYIRSSHQQLDAPEGSIDSTDNATNIWLSRQKRFGHEAAPMLCYSEANSFAKAIRAGLTADCLTISLGLDEQHQLIVLPNNSQSTEANRWLLEAIEKTAQSYQVKLWLNASAIESEQACALIAQQLNSVQNTVVQLNIDGTMTKSCQQLAESGVEFAMNVPNNINPDNAASWYDELMQQGWQPILLGNQQQFLALARLIGADWGLLEVEAKQLPWQTQDKLPAPKALLINTAWDINTR